MSMFHGAQNPVFLGGNFSIYSAHNERDKQDAQERAVQVLESHVAFGAFHNSKQRYNAPKCLPRTREAVFREISDWILVTSNEKPILWLYGPAGAGKSAIAQSIAEKGEEIGYLLVASFFFTRSDSQRNNAEQLVSSLAYQMILSLPSTRDFILAAVIKNPHLFKLNLRTQVKKLIVEPLTSVESSQSLNALPKLILVDGLDECTDSGERTDLIQALSEGFQEASLPLIILIASRPESDIRVAFNDTRTLELSSRIVLNNRFNPDSDIQTFLHYHFSEIKRTHPLKGQIPHNWPSHYTMEELVRKSSGQFIYASTVVKYITSRKHNPVKRLQVVLSVGSSSDASPFEELDALYRLVLSFIGEDDCDKVMRIIGMICFPPVPAVTSCLPVTPAIIDEVLNLGRGGTFLLLDDLHSLIDVRNPTDEIRPYHASLGDFLCDRSRSRLFYVDPGVPLADHTLAYFKFLLFISVFPMKLRTTIGPPKGHYEATLTTELFQFVSVFPWEMVIRKCDLGDYILPSLIGLHKGDDERFDEAADVYYFCKRASITSSNWTSICQKALVNFGAFFLSGIESSLLSRRLSSREMMFIRREVGSCLRRQYIFSILSPGGHMRGYLNELDSSDRFGGSKPGTSTLWSPSIFYGDITFEVLKNQELSAAYHIHSTRHNSAIFDCVLDSLFGKRLPCCDLAHWGLLYYRAGLPSLASIDVMIQLHKGTKEGGCREHRMILAQLLDCADRTSYLDQLLPYLEARTTLVSSTVTEAGNDRHQNGIEELREAISRYKEKPIPEDYRYGFQLDLTGIGPDTPEERMPYQFTIF